jgi:hypothetical protein
VNKENSSQKDAQLIVRIKKAERDTFMELCEKLDTSAAREIRRFIRDALARHAAGN